MSERQLHVTCDEIATKGGNRQDFERLLRRRVWEQLGRRRDVKPRRIYGRSVFLLPDDLDDAAVAEACARVPGVANFQVARPCENDFGAITALALSEVRRAIDERGVATFGVRCKRTLKTFAMSSAEVCRQLGAAVVTELGLKVDLTAPDLWVRVLVSEKGAFVSTDRSKGPGGLAVGSSGRVVSLLSGGLDSPVASYKMMLRGCEVTLCHFLNQGQDPLAVRTKIEDLADTLARYQGTSRLVVVPFAHLQRALVAGVPGPLRMLAYRRVMMRIATRLAAEREAEALVTGDSVGQVASQTLPNLQTIWNAAGLPVLAPLAGLSKLDIVAVAKQIGTYETSIEPAPDCCQFMIADHPATRSTPAQLAELEAAIPELAELEEAALAEAEAEERHFPPMTDARYPGEGGRRRRRRR